jgi:hypothetical protein
MLSSPYHCTHLLRLISLSSAIGMSQALVRSSDVVIALSLHASPPPYQFAQWYLNVQSTDAELGCCLRLITARISTVLIPKRQENECWALTQLVSF